MRVKIGHALFEQSDGRAGKIRVVKRVVHHNIRRFVLQLHDAELAGFVPENDEFPLQNQEKRSTILCWLASPRYLCPPFLGGVDGQAVIR